MDIEKHWAFGRDYDGFRLIGIKHKEELHYTRLQFGDVRGLSFEVILAGAPSYGMPSDWVISHVERKCLRNAAHLRERDRYVVNSEVVNHRIRDAANLSSEG